MARWKAIHWFFVVLGLLCVALVAAVIVGAASMFSGSDRNLEDFASPSEARAFASAHLPVPLPADARLDALRYERFTDWHFSARVRFASAEATDRYLEQVRRDRQLNDAYCGDTEPSGGARYVLADVFACGSIRRESAQALHVTCFTR
jgi:hypothetical protein